MGINGFDWKEIANEYSNEVTNKVSDYIETQVKAQAMKAGAKSKIQRSHGHTYRYKNTGELARNIKAKKDDDGHWSVSDGTRADYSKGYHGMYFLVEKAGEREIARILKEAKSFTEKTKL